MKSEISKIHFPLPDDDKGGSSTESADGGNGSNVQQQHLMLLTPLRPKEAAEAVQACHAAFTAAAVTAENNLSSDAATEDQLVPGGADAGGIVGEGGCATLQAETGSGSSDSNDSDAVYD